VEIILNLMNKLKEMEQELEKLTETIEEGDEE